MELAVSKAASDLASSDVEIAARAMNSLLRKEYRKQENKEAVVHEALSSLKEDQRIQEESPPKLDTETPPLIDDDWLNIFERYAENCSSDKARTLWAKVLAGEIRKPGQFSPKTMRFLSEFSQDEARIFSDVAAGAIDRIVPYAELGDNLTSILELEAAGLITGGSGGGLSQTYDLSSEGVWFYALTYFGLIVRGVPHTKIEVPILILTNVGREVLSLMDRQDEISILKAAARAFNKNKNTSGEIVRIIERLGESRMRHVPHETLWSRS